MDALALPPAIDAALAGFLRTLGTLEGWLTSPWLGLAWLGYVLVLAAWIIRQRREPVATLAWLLALAWLPVLGWAVYWWLGPQRVHRRKLKRLRARLVVMLIGIVAYDRLPVREYPKIDEPVVTVVEDAPGSAGD